jgi:hypothetical protein
MLQLVSHQVGKTLATFLVVRPALDGGTGDQLGVADEDSVLAVTFNELGSVSMKSSSGEQNSVEKVKTVEPVETVETVETVEALAHLLAELADEILRVQVDERLSNTF